MPTPTFSYFPIRGRGFVGRALLHSAGVEFNDDRVPLETWETVKATTPYGHVPFYQDDTVGVLTESGTIYRYLARAHGFAGSTAIEQVRVDEIFEIYFDIFRAAQKAYFGADAGGETVVRESETLSRQKFLANAVPQYVALTTRLLARNGNRGFLVGNSLTLADFQAFHVLNNWLRPLSPAAIAEVQPYLDGVRKANARFNSYLTNGGVAVTTEPSVFTFLNTPELF
eukprot:CAMPEP_0205819916 /NCGR_PEP_ID=MMETSP0206-20130828/2434_1 /ASSEMBLY_ACC=CAM_ASM_000279 /TAXON_ID=36767 /ORGANISM="Euplotes focardii, Strain TN1" /LENGTH=226 /DNA_ID=CAMNT_0053114033 /DNA_START=294 /DNA_END=971 /DNA_ORIENTATION=-